MGEIMTKGKYANSVVDKFCKENNIDRLTMSPEKWGDYIRGSGTLGICLEYLGLLSDKDLYYMSSRGGIHKIDPETFEVVTVRDYIDSLPDDETPDKEIVRLLSDGSSLVSLINLFRKTNIDDYAFNINVKVTIDHVNRTVSIVDG